LARVAGVLHCVAVCCGALQCARESTARAARVLCCSMLQCAAVCERICGTSSKHTFSKSSRSSNGHLRCLKQQPFKNCCNFSKARSVVSLHRKVRCVLKFQKFYQTCEDTTCQMRANILKSPLAAQSAMRTDYKADF